MRRAILIASGLLALAGCSTSQDTSAAEAAIGTFHRQLDTGQFQASYDGGSDDLKGAIAAPKWVELLSAVHRKLGAFQSGKSVGWTDNMTTSGHMVSINYAAQYQNGAAAESFTYRIDGGKALLAGYHVNSDALILR